MTTRSLRGRLLHAQWPLYAALVVWFAPFVGLPMPLGVFLGFSAVIVLAGLVVPTYTLPVFAVVMLFFPQNIVNGTGTFTFTFVLLAACALAAAAYVRSGRGRELIPTRRVLLVVGVLVVLFCIWIGLGFAHSVPLSQQVVVLRVVGLALAAGFLVRGVRPMRPLDVSRTAAAISVAGVLLAIVVVVQGVLGSAPFLDAHAQAVGYTSVAFGGRVGGNVGHPIIAGLVLVIAALVAAAMRVPGWWLVALSCLGASALTGSRSAWLAAGIGALLLAAAALRERVSRRVFAVSAASVLTIIGCFIVALLLEPVQNFLAGNPLLRRLNIFVDASAGYRQNRIEAAWSLIADSPIGFLLGHGPGFGNDYLQRVGIGDGQPDTFDQSYLGIWIDFGLVGAIGLFLPLAWIAIRRWGRVEGVLAVVFLIASAFVMILNWAALLALAVFAVAWSRGESSSSAAERLAPGAVTSGEVTAPARGRNGALSGH